MKNFTTTLVILFTLLNTSIRSQTWENIDSGTNYILYGISFPPGQNAIGYAAGMLGTYNGPGVIIKTENFGETWNQILPEAGDINGIQAICFTSETKGFAGGWNNYFIKTTDGGETWTEGFVHSNIWYFTDIEFWDENNGVASAQMDPPGQPVFITNDGGETWTQASGLSQVIFDLSYADESTVYAVGNAGAVSRSTDGGLTWNDIYSLGGGLSFGVDFYNSDFGVVGGEDGKIATTTDGGQSWSIYSTGYHNFWAVQTFSEHTAYAGGTDEDIYVTTDGGQNWAVEHNGSSSSTLYKIKFTSNNNGFASGSQGKMLKKSAPFVSDFYADQTEICAGDTVHFYNNSSTAAIIWEWIFEGGDPATSSEEDPVVVYDDSGSFDVQLTIGDGSQTAENLKEDYIIAAEYPTPVIEGAAIVCDFQEEEYITSFIEGNTYNWQVEGGTIVDGLGTHFITILWGGEGDGSVSVMETNAYGCETTELIQILIDDCTGIQEYSNITIDISPNPAFDRIDVDFESKLKESFNVTIVDLIGQIVYRTDSNSLTGDPKFNVNVSKFNRGIYILQIKFENGKIAMQKFIKD